MRIKKKCGEISCVRYDVDSILCEYCELNSANFINRLEGNNHGKEEGSVK